jgi:hypothetical protein
VDDAPSMDPWLHQIIAVERRDRWIRAAAAARETQRPTTPKPGGDDAVPVKRTPPRTDARRLRRALRARTAR